MTHYAFTAPYVLMPDIESSEITDPLADGGYHVIIPIAQGLDTSGADSSVTALLTTSDEAFSKISGYDMSTYEKEEGDLDGPYTLAVSIEDSTAGGRIVWVATDYLLDGLYNSYSSGANLDLAMNSLSWDDRRERRGLHPRQIPGLQLSDHLLLGRHLAEDRDDRRDPGGLPAAGY